MANSAWYPFYPGDHARDTGHLSLMQEGALRRLLDHYYSTGGPLPSDLGQLYRICRAFDEGERAAVVSVLQGFFVQDACGWRNSKADRVIEVQAEKAKVYQGRAKKAAETRWNKNTSSNASSINQAVLEQCQPEPEPEPEQKPESKPSCGKQSRTDCPPPPSLPVVVVVDEGAPVVLIPLSDKTEFPVFEKHVAEFAEAYPAVDIVAQLKAMRAWSISNPKQRKTKAGVMRFVNMWLAKEQDKGGARGKVPGMGKQSALEERNRIAGEAFNRGEFNGAGETGRSFAQEKQARTLAAIDAI